MANQIQSCFRRYEKKYRLTAAQQRFLLEGNGSLYEKGCLRRIHHLQHLL